MLCFLSSTFECIYEIQGYHKLNNIRSCKYSLWKQHKNLVTQKRCFSQDQISQSSGQKDVTIAEKVLFHKDNRKKIRKGTVKAQMMRCHFYDSGKHPEPKLRNMLSFPFCIGGSLWSVTYNLAALCTMDFQGDALERVWDYFLDSKQLNRLQFARCLNETWGKHSKTGYSLDIKEIPFEEFTFPLVLIFYLSDTNFLPLQYSEQHVLDTIGLFAKLFILFPWGLIGEAVIGCAMHCTWRLL